MFPHYRSVEYHRTFDQPLFSHNQLWLVTVVAGVVNGVVRGAIRDGAHILFDWRIDAMKAVVETNIWLVVPVFLGISLVLIFLAAGLVILEPLTAGTGTADVAAALNAIHVPRFFTFRTAVIKFLTTLLTSASGLIWVGPESSMSHLGAATNLLVADFMRRLMRTNEGRAKLNDAERLDLIGTGMAMGIGAAFRTTLAGIIYMAEGMAPLWRPAAFWRALVGTGLAVYVAKLIDNYFVCRGENKVMCVSPLGYVAYPLRFRAEVDLLTFFAILCTSVFSGVAGGLFASACGLLGSRLSTWMPQDRKVRRVLMALAGMTVTCLLIMCLVIVTPCRRLPVSGLEAGSSKFIYSERNFCSEPESYNPAAVILLSHHEYAVRYLYNDDIYLEYWLIIACWLLVYVLAIPFVYMPLPVGFVTPNLLSGALVGRFFAQAIGCKSQGVVAVCGSAASLASYFRFPLTSSIFMIQTTSAGRLYMAIIGSVIVSTAIAYPFSPSLMEIIMRIKRVPYLPRLHRSIVEFLRGKLITEFMTSQVVSIRKNCSASEIQSVLASHPDFSGFPVVTDEGKVMAVVTRDALERRNDLQCLHPSFNAFIVESNHDFLRCYRLFRHLGLKHMVVVDNLTKKLVGVVTRGDLVKAITSVPKPHYYYVTL